VGKFQVGDIISAKVININPKERRIGLSIKQLETDEEHDLVVDYLSTYKGSESSLGELLKDNLKEKTVDQDLAEEPPEIADDKIEETDTEGGAEVAGDDTTEQVEEAVEPEVAEEAPEIADEKVEEKEMEGGAEVAGEDTTEQVPVDETGETADIGIEDAVEPEVAEQETDKEA
jgi:small subunit ribosomal protein S1